MRILLEQPFLLGLCFLGVAVAQLLGEPCNELALFFVELPRYLDGDIDVHIALLVLIELLYAEALHAERLLRGGAPGC